MKITIPQTKRERMPDEVTFIKEGCAYDYPRVLQGIKTTAKVKPEEYALMDNNREVNQAISMIQSFNELGHMQTHKELFKKSLTMPSVPSFSSHLINANIALNDEAPLYDASGKVVRGNRLVNYVYNLNHICWIRLNASFVHGTGFMNLDILKVEGFSPDGKPLFSREPLEDCLEVKTWIDLRHLNRQGLPIRKSPIGDKYEPGKTAYFSCPVKESVGGYNATTNVAVFSFDNGYGANYPNLGTFPLVEVSNA